MSTGKTGIFPLTHMEELHFEPCGSLSLQNKGLSAADKVICESVVISNLSAQLDGELDLIEGQTVEILKFLDDGFAFGRCQGESGQFPMSFVKTKDQTSEPNSSNHYSKQPDVKSSNKCNSNVNHCIEFQPHSDNGYTKGKKSHSRKGSYTQANTSSHDSYVMPYAQAHFPFAAVNEGELSFAANEIVTLISHIDDEWAEGEISGKRGIFPTSYVNIIVDCQSNEDTGHVICPTAAGDASPEIYGRVLYDFNADHSEELKLFEGDTVTILQQLDVDWYLARHDDNRVGRCPVSYIEVFGCEPLHGVTTPSSSTHPHQELNQSRSSFTNIPSVCANVKQRPTVRPKPKLISSSVTVLSEISTISSEDKNVKQNFSKSDAMGFEADSGDSMHPPRLWKHHPNTRMSLDNVVQHELQRGKVPFDVREKRNSDGRPQSVSILELEATELTRAKNDFKGTQIHHQTFESPVPMPRILRPNSLGVTEESKCNRKKSKDRPTPPPRPSDSKLSPMKPKIIPKRPAPPCPTSRTSVRSHSHNDLMIFSPERLALSSDTLVARSSTPTMDPAKNLPTSPSIHSSNMKSEFDLRQTDEKRREKRQRVIAELLQTESDYVNCLVLCLKTFSSETKFCPLDLEMLFGNADEVVELSQQLLTLIEQNVETKPFEMQCVGKCFLELNEQFRRVYAPYCRNHDSVIALLEKYEGNAEISEFIQAALDKIRHQMQVFDLHSILIRPVQRILKYPLLLSELERATDDGHADKRHLITSISTMTHIAAYINEYKRRKDLVFKYKQETDVKFGDKISRLSMHSTMKKLSRISRKMVGIQTVDEGFNFEEQRFKALDNAVRNLAKDISQYIEQCQEVSEGRGLVAVNIAEFYTKEAPEHEIEKFCEVHNQISRKSLLEFKEEIVSDILPPLNSLLLMYQGPQKVIRKRYDKLLDYDNAAARQRSIGDSDQAKAMDEELTITRNNYEALNAQLLDDLPKLYLMSMEILLECLKWFINIQHRFLRNAVEKLHSLLRLPLLLGTSSCPNIVEAFNIAHATVVDKISDFSFIPKSFNPQVDEVRKMKERRSIIDGIQKLIDIEDGGNQCDGHRIHLKQRYPAERLFWVCRDFVGEQTMDLTLSTGALVAVIKEGDPMGNRDRWFVDNGAEKGFAHKDCLSSKQPTSNMALSSSGSVSKKAINLLDWPDPASSSMPFDSSLLRPSSSASIGQTLNLTISNQNEWVKCDDNPSPQSSKESISSSNFVYNQFSDISSNVFYRAVYEFAARSQIELSVKNGEIVRVLQKHDLDGTKEWWHVERDDGERGYVPANYLYAVNYP